MSKPEQPGPVSKCVDTYRHHSANLVYLEHTWSIYDFFTCRMNAAMFRLGWLLTVLCWVLSCFLTTLILSELSRTPKKKSETELTAIVLKKRFKTLKILKERFFIGRNRTKRAHFRGSPLFQATYNRKTEKQTINTTCLESVGYGKLAEGKGHETGLGLGLGWTNPNHNPNRTIVEGTCLLMVMGQESCQFQCRFIVRIFTFSVCEIVLTCAIKTHTI